MSKSLRPSSSALVALAALAFLASSAASPAHAGPVPMGAKFRLSSCTTCMEEKPAIAGSPSGGFLAAWDGSTAQDLQGVTARLFGPTNATTGADFAVDANKLPPQADAAVASDAAGNYIVAWSSVLSGSSEVLAQRYASNGKAVGTQVRVNVDPPSPAIAPDDFKPAVTLTPDGGFVVVWISLVPPNLVADSVPLVLARRFGPDNVATGPQVQLNTGLVSGDRPSVCSDGAGRYIAVWTSVDGYHPFEASKYGVSGRRVSPVGAFLGGEMIVATPLSADSTVSISCGLRNNFVITWDTDQAPSSPLGGIVAQRYSRGGKPFSPPFLVASGQRLMRNPAVTNDTRGNIIIAWQADDPDSSGLFARRYSAAGVPLEDAFNVFRVGLGTPRPVSPTLTHTGTAGGFVVVWGGSGGLFGRRYSVSP